MAGLKDVLTPEKMLELLTPPNKMSLSKIGVKYHVSRQRIHQIYHEYRRYYPDMFRPPREPEKSEIENLLKKNITLTEIADNFGISVARLKKIMSRYGIKKYLLKICLPQNALKICILSKKRQMRK